MGFSLCDGAPRSIAIEPEVLLADKLAWAYDPEPDPINRRVELPLKECDTHGGLAHSLQRDVRAADRAVFKLMGKLVESGDTGILFTNPIKSRARMKFPIVTDNQ